MSKELREKIAELRQQIARLEKSTQIDRRSSRLSMADKKKIARAYERKIRASEELKAIIEKTNIHPTHARRVYAAMKKKGVV